MYILIAILFDISDFIVLQLGVLFLFFQVVMLPINLYSLERFCFLVIIFCVLDLLKAAPLHAPHYM